MMSQFSEGASQDSLDEVATSIFQQIQSIQDRGKRATLEAALAR